MKKSGFRRNWGIEMNEDKKIKNVGDEIGVRRIKREYINAVVVG